MAMSSPEIKLAFASCSQDLIDQFVEEVWRMGRSGVPVYCVSEFQPSAGLEAEYHWIPWMPFESVAENRARIAWRLRGKRILYNAILLQPRQPYWPMRWAGFLTAPLRTYCFNENYGHFALHPRSSLTMLRHFAWRTKNWFRHEFRPGGWIYTMIWRLGHPFSWERPFYARVARGRKPLQTLPPRAEPEIELAPGVTVVIPSRDGQALLEKLLPQLVDETEATRIIVVDNGSSDGSAELRFARVEFLIEPEPLSFAAAVNKGIRAARTTHVCLLNNDMEIAPGFFRTLRRAFDEIPDLFCATAQIFFPPGQRRQETGKAVYWPGSPRDLPLRCLEPMEGEDLSPVLYGSGGCSLFDTAKLRAIGCLKESFRPAYVEDLDLGWRGWQQGWPTVFVAGAQVVHHHRATTSRFFRESQIELAVESNFLRWILSSVASRESFARLWPAAVQRLNLRAAVPEPAPIETFALRFAAFHKPYFAWDRPAPAKFDETEILALGSGRIACFPGSAGLGRPALIVASCYLPFPLSHGGAVRIFNLLREAAKDYAVILVCFTDQPAAAPPELLALCREVILVERQGSHWRRDAALPKAVDDFHSEPFRAALRWAIRRHRPFAVQLEFTQMAQYAADVSPVPAILVEHDVTIDLYRQLSRDSDDFDLRRETERWEKFEQAAWRSVDAVVVMSAKDAGIVQGAKRVAVLENGVDLERFQPSLEAAESRRLLFLGSFAHLPNLLALEWFLDEVWPRLDGYTLHLIAGKNPEYWLDYYRDRVQVNLAREGVEMEGFVSDVRPAYRRAAAVIAPLLASAGTNIKILEAMAMGKAIVATSGGVNGLRLSPGTEFLLADSDEEFAQALGRLSADPHLRQSLESQARRRAEASFGWNAIGHRQRELYKSLRATAQ
jgi:GT2 family glycosyltransferase/glycosyltransferase involved in cell wall biosynthesis